MRIDHGSTYKCTICDVEVFAADHTFPRAWDSLYVCSADYIYSDSVNSPLKVSFHVCGECRPNFHTPNNDTDEKKASTNKTIKKLFSLFFSEKRTKDPANE